MKNILAAIAVYALTICAAFGLISYANAGPLEDFKNGYAAGTALSDKPDYVKLYSVSTNRVIEFQHVTDNGDWINAYYRTTMQYEGADYEQHGVASLFITDGVVTDIQYATIDKERYDLAMAGQLADIATTGIALSSGFSEVNPLAATPAGMAAVVGAKIGLVKLSEAMPLADCVVSKAALGGLGWGAAGWNAGLMLASPPVALAVGLVSGVYFWKQAKASAPTNCVKRIES